MYEITSYPLVSLTFATFLMAEFGFFGVVVYTLVHTPAFEDTVLSALTWNALSLAVAAYVSAVVL